MNVRPRYECPRHGPMAVKPSGISLRWIALRCSHYGQRFVVELRNEDLCSSMMDYVEDLPDGDVIVETHVLHGRHPTLEALWDSLVARLVAGDPPDPEILDVRR